MPSAGKRGPPGMVAAAEEACRAAAAGMVSVCRLTKRPSRGSAAGFVEMRKRRNLLWMAE
jgi:hypothetical protein